MEKESITQRIAAFAVYKGQTIRALENSCGLGNGTLSKLSDKTRKSTIDRIVYAYPELNRDWLLTGEGEMLRPSAGETVPAGVSGKAIRFFPDIDATMGGVQFLDNPNETALPMYIPGYEDCQYAIVAHGDSMQPLIKSGQIILFSDWKENFIDWGKIYLIVTNGGYRMIKRIFPNTDDTVLCKSENYENNPPIEINKKDITRLFIVKGWLHKDV